MTTALKSADSPAAAGPLQLELAKFFYVVAVSLSPMQFLNDIPQSTAAMKQAMKDPASRPQAVRLLAEMSELRDGRDAGLELFQYVVDNEASDAQTWLVGLVVLSHAVLPRFPARARTERPLPEGGGGGGRQVPRVARGGVASRGRAAAEEGLQGR